MRFCPSCGTRVVDADVAVGLVGRTLSDKYRVLSVLGAGSMGKVYLAEHIGLRKKVAIKVLHSDLLVSEETLQRFQREGIAAGKFNHPNAIQIFDFDRVEGLCYLAMEYVQGRTLNDWLRENGPLEPAVAVSVVLQILGALGEAHEQGIVHRDLKPDNVMVLRGASGGLSVKVLDFGLSKLVDRPLNASLVTQIGRIMGTPLYMAPEQANGQEVDHRTDLYAVGLVLYECLTGRPPFQGTSITEIIVKQATQPPPSIFEANPSLGVPVGLEDVIRRALEKAPEQRFQSAADMMAALESVDLAVLASPRGAARRHAAPPTPRPAPRTADGATPRTWSKLVRGLLVLAAVVIGIAALGALWPGAGGGSTLATSAAPRVREKPAGERSELERAYLQSLDGAREHLTNGRLESARALVDSAKAMSSADAEAVLLRGRIAFAAGDRDLARLDFEDALERDASYAEARQELGWIDFENGELDAAREQFTASPGAESSGALAGQGALALEGGDSAEALELLTRAVELDASDPRAQEWLGLAQLESGAAEAALSSLSKAKRNGSISWRTYAALGDVYARQGRMDDALRELARAVELDPRAIDSLADAALALVEDERHAEAAALLGGPLARGTSSGRAQLAYGVALHGLERTSEAVGALERGLADATLDASDAARGRILLGILYQSEERDDAAFEQYRAALALDDAFAVPHENLGLILMQRERFDEARAELERAVELDPKLAFAHFALGILNMDYLGDAAKAAGHFASYRALGGDDPRVAGWMQSLGRR